VKTRYDLWQTEREAAEVTASGLKVLRGEHPFVTVKVWMPKATKPAAFYKFRSVEQREQWLERYVSNYAANQAARAEYRAEKKAKASENAQSVDVGTIFVHSWGYDQTNIDYYQVVKKSGQMVEVAAIAAEEVEGSQGFMCATVKPLPGAFLSKSYRMQDAHGNYRKTLRKRLQFTERGDPYLSFEYGWCGVNKPGESRYSSWYA